MKSYLSNIVSRATQTPEVLSIKPMIRTWPMIKDTANNLNPFEGKIESQDAPEQLYFPSTKKRFENNTRLDKDMDPQIISSSNNLRYLQKAPSIITKHSDMPSVQQKIIRPHHSTSETFESFMFHKKDEKTWNLEKTPLGEKHQVNKKQIIKKSEKIIEKQVAKKIENNIQTVTISKTGGRLGPDSFETKRLTKESMNPNPMIKTTEEGRKTLEKGKPESERQRQPTSLIKVIEMAPSEPKGVKEPERRDCQPVLKLHPRTPPNSPPIPMPKPKYTGQKLVIGSLKVEVVAPSPLKTAQLHGQSTRHIIKSERKHDNGPGGFKLRFGLGQV